MLIHIDADYSEKNILFVIFFPFQIVKFVYKNVRKDIKSI